MTSSGIDHVSRHLSDTPPAPQKKGIEGEAEVIQVDVEKKSSGSDDDAAAVRPSSSSSSSAEGSIKVGYDATHRTLKARHIQLIGIGGTVGTALYVQIGQGLLNGGPGSLFLAFTMWCSVILAITLCTAEMVSYLPISSPFIRFASRYVDDALGFAAGWNFFIFEAALVPFEVVACNMIIHFWSDAVPVGGIIAIIIVLYALINLLAVKWYGEAEFWAALGKVVLIICLVLYTFIVMLGGNPLGDRFGFRYWKTPGSFAELYRDGGLGRFLGFLQCLIQASFTIAGPDYVSLAAGECENPRVVMPRAYRAVFYRLTAFFVLGALCVGILVPYDDPELRVAFDNDAPGAAASPYVVSMHRLGIPVLPHLVNALVLTACFSAGNSYVFCASRSLYGLALDGKAPRFLTRCTAAGVPLPCVLVVLAFALLSLLQLSNGSAVVLSWLVNLVTASQLINYAVMALTYLCFRAACDAQHVDRAAALPFRSPAQPALARYALVCTAVMTVVGGYPVFLPGNWDLPTFLFSYMMVFLFPVLFLGWKLLKRTRWRDPARVDLRRDLDAILAYERDYVPRPASSPLERGLDRLFG